jgi:hypothetical protein
MRLLPPRLGPYSPPHVGAYLQLSEGSRDGNSAAVISRPSLSILTRHMYSTTDDPCQVLKIAVPSTSTLVWYRTPAGLVLADGTEHGDHDRFNVNTSNTVDGCTAVLHRVTLISLARAPALQLCA